MRPNYPDTHPFSPHYVSQIKWGPKRKQAPAKELKQFPGNVFATIGTEPETDTEMRSHKRKAITQASI